MGGLTTAANGITGNPNIPTEEVFTTPHCQRTDGTVASTKPLVLPGHPDRGDRGPVRSRQRSSDARARTGQAVLERMIGTDEGARRLGEVALVPAASPIAQSGLLFLNTLFDENAASHIALGQSYSKCFTDGGATGDGGADRARRQHQPDPRRLDDRLANRSTSTASRKTATPNR